MNGNTNCCSLAYMTFCWFYRAATRRLIIFQSGWGTDEEMCNTFLYYYPWMESQFCLSESLEDSFPVPGKNQTQVNNYTQQKRSATHRSNQFSEKSQSTDQVRLYLFKSMSVTAALHIFCNQGQFGYKPRGSNCKVT